MAFRAEEEPLNCARFSRIGEVHPTRYQIARRPLVSYQAWMAIVCPSCALSFPRDLKQRCLGKIVAHELHRQRQTTGRKTAHHRERGMAGDIERRASLTRISALDRRRVIDT